MDLMSLLTGFDNRFAGGRAANDPAAVAEANDYAAKLKQSMIEQELMRRGIGGPAPQVPARSNWQDTTGLGGRMAALVPSLDQPAAAPYAAQPDQGLLMRALANAAGEDMVPITTRRTGSGTYSGPAIQSTGIPMQAQPWYDEYLAAAKGGAPLPMVMGDGGGTPIDKEKQAAYRQQRQAKVDSRQANVQSNAVAKRVARHDRMGIPDSGMFFDDLERLQAMQGQQGGDAASPLGYLMNALTAGGQYAQGAMEGQLQNARQAWAMKQKEMELTKAWAIAISQNPAASPQEKAMAMSIINSGGQGGSMGQGPPPLPSMVGMTPQQAYEASWGQDPDLVRRQFEHENPDVPYGNPTLAAPGKKATLGDAFETFGGMGDYEKKRLMEKTPYVGGLWRWLNELTGYNPEPPPPRIQFN